MCWLYLRSTEKTRKVSSNYLRKFYTKGGDINPDGWGITSHMAKINDFTLMKEPVNASNSMVAHAVGIQSGLPRTRAIIAHVRKMSIGVVSYKNTQPMNKTSIVTGQPWAFAHNGTAEADKVKDLDKDVMNNCSYVPVTDLDSERLFIEFIDCIDRIMPEGDNSTATFNTLHEFFEALNDYAKMCIVATNGDLSFAYRDLLGRRQLHLLKDNSGYVVCTKDLTKGDWKSFSPGQLLVFKKGKIIFNSHALVPRETIVSRYFGKDKTKDKTKDKSWKPEKGEPVFPSTKWDFEFPEDEYLMGRDNFYDEAEAMGFYQDLDDTIRSDGRRDYGDVSLYDGQDGHNFTEYEV